MHNLNNVFFEEFKRLDRLCRDMYPNSHDGKLGVTLYLNDMDTPRKGERNVLRRAFNRRA